MLACSTCHLVRYCDAACQVAAWGGHKAECEAERAKREERLAPHIVAPSGGASAA